MVVAHPKSAKDAWDLITDIVKDNKRSRTSALKAELRSIKLGDLSMEAYFRKIESIVTILTSLDSPVNDEDVVHHALEGLSDKYDQVCGIMQHKGTFLDLKTARSMLITKEMRLKSKSLALPARSRGTKDNENTTNKLLAKLLKQLGTLGVNNTVSPTPVAYHTGSIPYAGPTFGPTYPLRFPQPANPLNCYTSAYVGPNNPSPPVYLPQA
ncbi:ribonuclease H-like domain-containing protein [Tanacetum coccineum]